jgi:hypothetical protein
MMTKNIISCHGDKGDAMTMRIYFGIKHSLTTINPTVTTNYQQVKTGLAVFTCPKSGHYQD